MSRLETLPTQRADNPARKLCSRVRKNLGTVPGNAESDGQFLGSLDRELPLQLRARHMRAHWAVRDVISQRVRGFYPATWSARHAELTQISPALQLSM